MSYILSAKDAPVVKYIQLCVYAWTTCVYVDVYVHELYECFVAIDTLFSHSANCAGTVYKACTYYIV